MKVIVNGDPFETAQAGSIAGLLEEMRIGEESVAVLLNGELVPAGDRGECRLSEGDAVELFRFVAGG